MEYRRISDAINNRGARFLHKISYASLRSVPYRAMSRVHVRISPA